MTTLSLPLGAINARLRCAVHYVVGDKLTFFVELVFLVHLSLSSSRHCVRSMSSLLFATNLYSSSLLVITTAPRSGGQPEQIDLCIVRAIDATRWPRTVNCDHDYVNDAAFSPYFPTGFIDFRRNVRWYGLYCTNCPFSEFRHSIVAFARWSGHLLYSRRFCDVLGTFQNNTNTNTQICVFVSCYRSKITDTKGCEMSGTPDNVLLNKYWS